MAFLVGMTAGATSMAWGAPNVGLRMVLPIHVSLTLALLNGAMYGYAIAVASYAVLSTAGMMRSGAMLQEVVKLRVSAARQARRDVLTGAPTRLAFAETIADRIDAGLPCALLLVDLDGFNAVNDTRGHAAGDRVLVESVARLSRAAGDPERVFRLGGDEFAVLLENPHDVAHCSTCILDLFSEPFEVGGVSSVVSASIGMVVGDGSLSSDELLARADRALYVSKAQGRNRATRFEEPDSAALDAARLEAALDAFEFVPYYQPIFDLQTGRVSAIESLVRWRRPGGVVGSPELFMAAVEQAALHHRLGQRIVMASLRDRERLAEAGLIDDDVRMHVNLSPIQLDSVDRVHAVASCAADHGYRLDRLTVELTETSLLGDVPLARAYLDTCKRYGVEVALDDFGTGYSSLSLVCDAPVDQLKIDRSFVTGVVEIPSCRAVVAAVVQLGQHLGLSVTAEGVESTYQVAALRELGVQPARGRGRTRR